MEDAEGRKGRIFEAFSGLLARADTAPRVLVLEDLHWADRTSQELVAHLAREVEPQQTLILATYRTDAQDRTPALGNLLERLNRERRRDEVRLLPLSPEELSFLAEGLLQRVLPSRLVDGLHGRSGGNPFYAEELLYALKDRGTSNCWCRPHSTGGHRIGAASRRRCATACSPGRRAWSPSSAKRWLTLLFLGASSASSCCSQ
ncbi:AAA family ATPase [Deinococcus malanensis]|uniref:AAA family ATPase n=1 Tax=Deinococcus malanensis TaxID=1706855 RepID=UPI00364009F6